MTAVFQKVCACPGGPAKVEVYATDQAAAAAAYRHWLKRATTDDAHRYWNVHGPSGHVVSLHDTPIGDLPPHPRGDGPHEKCACSRCSA